VRFLGVKRDREREGERERGREGEIEVDACVHDAVARRVA
jgi:hypothetical protein